MVKCAHARKIASRVAAMKSSGDVLGLNRRSHLCVEGTWEMRKSKPGSHDACFEVTGQNSGLREIKILSGN